MSHNLFGWSLPPGCTNSNIEDACGGDVPKECESCDLYNEDLETCPYEGIEDLCYKLSLIKECAKCKTPLCKVKGNFKHYEIAHGWVEQYCCCKECAATLQKEIDEEFKDLGEPLEPSEEEIKRVEKILVGESTE